MDTRNLRQATAAAAVTTAAFAITLGFTTPIAAEVPAHAERAAEIGKLGLDNGRKWEPDRPLREADFQPIHLIH